MKQTKCKLCGKPFVCDNGRWSTTCDCARQRPDDLEERIAEERKFLREAMEKFPCFWAERCCLTPARLKRIRWDAWKNGLVFGSILYTIIYITTHFLIWR